MPSLEWRDLGLCIPAGREAGPWCGWAALSRRAYERYPEAGLAIKIKGLCATGQRAGPCRPVRHKQLDLAKCGGTGGAQALCD